MKQSNGLSRTISKLRSGLTHNGIGINGARFARIGFDEKAIAAFKRRGAARTAQSFAFGRRSTGIGCFIARHVAGDDFRLASTPS
jgi:hypothetical protein